MRKLVYKNTLYKEALQDEKYYACITTEETKKMMVIQPAVPTDESAENTEASYMASDMYQRIVALINNFAADLLYL